MNEKDDIENDNRTPEVGTDFEAKMMAAIAGAGPGAVVDPTNYRQTDAGNAQLFVAMFGHILRFVEAWCTWMWWNGRLWVEVSDTALTPLATQATEHMIHWAATLPEDERTKLRKHGMGSQKKERLRAMIDLAKGDERVRAEPERFDADKWLLGCAGMTLDLRAQKVRIPTQEDYITKSTGIDPDFEMGCPNWLALLNWACDGDEETIRYLKHAAGYLLTGDVSEEILFAFFGSGGNGKTTIAMTLFEMLGDYAGKARSDLLLQAQGEKGSASPDVAALQGKRLVVVSETDDNCSLAEAQVKAVTSNEPITARRLYGAPFTFMPTHKTLLMTNHRPFVKGTDEGIWRRLNIIGFEARLTDSEKVRDFRESKLIPELPGILGWAIEGCLEWQRDGLKPSAAVEKATKSYRSEMDFIAHWLEARTVDDPEGRVSLSDAYRNYKWWAQGDDAPVLGKRRFNEELRGRGYRTSKSHGDLVFNGLRLSTRAGLDLAVVAAE